MVDRAWGRTPEGKNRHIASKSRQIVGRGKAKEDEFKEWTQRLKAFQSWPNPKIGRRKLHHDVACQIHDWDGDGSKEVIVCTKGYIVELDGATGGERRRIRIAAEASDCVVFADLSGRTRTNRWSGLLRNTPGQ
jgi:hypothetical protein